MLPVEQNHLIDIHAIDVIGAEHRYQIRPERLDQAQALVDGVGGSVKHLRARMHLRRHHRHELIGSSGDISHALRTCSIKDCALYCTSR